MSITLWCDANLAAGGLFFFAVRPHVRPPYFAIYHLDSLSQMKHLFLLKTYSNFSVLNFILNVLLPYCSYCFPYFLSFENCLFLLTGWVWKLSNNACLLKLIPSASFLTQRHWLKKKVDQLLCGRKEALRTRLVPTKTMVRC